MLFAPSEPLSLMKLNASLAARSCFIAFSLEAVPLTEARVNKIINEVSVSDPAGGARPAKLNELIKDEIGLKTGIKSRSELLFQDETLTRIGPETYFSFKPGTREMALQQGTMLLQVPKGPPFKLAPLMPLDASNKTEPPRSVTVPPPVGAESAVRPLLTTIRSTTISSSAQLLSLLSGAAAGPGGKITITSAGGDVAINGGTLRADRGQIEIRNNGSSGTINLTNANLNASVIKAGALGSDGTLNVGGGTLNADSQIKRYAGGSNGQVNFTNNVTLNGNSVKTIAADAVTIFNGKVVTVNGPGAASVLTNNPNYTGFGGNGSTTGTFAGQGATTQPLPGPGF